MKIIYDRCGHTYIGHLPGTDDATRHLPEYCPDCHRKLMLAEVEQGEGVECERVEPKTIICYPRYYDVCSDILEASRGERCVCCGSYVGGDLCEQS